MPLLQNQEDALNRVTQVNAYLYIHQPTLVFEAPLVGARQRKKAYVALEVGTPTVGTWGAVKPEMTVQIDINGTADGGRQRVRGKDIPANEILIGRAGVGRTEGRVNVQDGGTVRVYADYRPYIKAPYISPDNLEQYKDEELYPSDDEAQPPVANAGTDRLILTEDATVTITLDALGDVPSFAVRAGATLSAYLWDVGDGTITTGTDTDDSIEVEFPRGARYISLRVTDSNGTQHTTHRLIVVARKRDCVPAQIDTYTLAPDGATCTVTVDSANLPETMLTGTKVLLAELDNYGQTEVATYRERFTGWLGTETANLTNARDRFTAVTLDLYDVAQFLKQNYLFPQSINIAEGTGGWYQMPDANIDRLMHHILQWHTNVLSLSGFKWSGLGTTYPFAAFTTSGGAFWNDISELANAVAHQLTVDTRGTVRVVKDPHIQPTAAQATEYTLPTQRSTSVVTTLGLERYSRHSFIARPDPSAYWLEASALIADDVINDVVSCIAPSNAPSFGVSSATRQNWLVTKQQELNVWAGNLYAASYAPPYDNLSLTLLNPAHFIEPALREYVNVTLPDYITDRYAVTDDRWTVERISYSYDGALKRATYTLKKEVTAPEPARTTIQTEDATTVQAWSGFDTAIDTTTGAITQEFEGLMSLTQAQLEESLNALVPKVRLAMYIADHPLTEGEASGDDTTDTDGTAAANAAATGGYYEITLRLNKFLSQASDYYADIYVSGHVDEKTAFKAYVNGVLTDVDSVSLDTWTDYLFAQGATPDFPTLTVAQRQDAAEQMYCEASAYGGLTQFAASLTTMTTPTFEDFSTFQPVLSVTQLSAWYTLGRVKPLDLYRAYYCTLADTGTAVLNAAAVTSNTITYAANSNAFNWNSRTDGSLMRVQASGRYEDDDSIVDAFYVYDKVAETYTYDPPLLGVREPANSAAGANGTVVSIPAYRADGIYDVTLTVTDYVGGNLNYVARNDRPVSGTVISGTPLTFVFSDLGAQ